MRAAHTVQQVRDAEADLMRGLPEGALMQRAATGLATAIADLLGATYGARVLLLVGGGDNGGDALWAGAVLARRGASVEAVLLSEHAHAEGLAALRARGGRVVTATESSRPDVVVDGVVGIGGRPGLRPEAVEALAQHPGVPVVAVDVPSGVDVDSGRVDGDHVRADLTVTFGTHKVAHLVDPAAEAAGVVHLVDLGLDLPDAAVTALQATDVAALLPRPGGVDHKYTRGVVGVRAGSDAYPGAAVLCTAGAATGLAGMVRYAGAAADAVRAAHPEVVVGGGRVQAWVVGSGGDADAEQALADALADGVPTVVDADALQHVRTHGGELVLTPHAGELARMLDLERAEVEADGLAVARRAAATYGATVLLKGRHTLVARPDGAVRVTTSGVPWLAVAGAGDVLAGIIGSLLAGGLDPFDAASVGSWLHGAAATLVSDGGPLRAGAVADAVPTTVRRLLL
ncbi:bifunctional ADP-dependent NAD(P)H-hydrate dehydratase/NAD(P)H-hydrate epimerase [Nocardioides aequoreus]|uniref:bifunctional ADP-dependent NAD(P)H-hydrate dehydratase/NAD(P)H-hydrate epimerase n=1 Tax=Nocardioides aequoreus TaxID=397278 RepID=UPI0004C2FB35|nr:bifunctional ADP-dependent NAD(P)H-hydrate dehydratase/NAD(P)H-hydrate epimerase [Nocardioides aequoreus]